MKKHFQKIVSACLCLILCCSCFIMAPQSASANPIVIPAATGALELVAWVCGLLGITFASQGELVRASNEFLTDNPSVALGAIEVASDANLASNASGEAILKLTSSGWSYVTNTLIPSIQMYFSKLQTSLLIDVQDSFQGLVGQIRFTNLITFSSPVEAFAYCPYSFADITIEHPLTFTVNGTAYSIYMQGRTSDVHFVKLYNKGVAFSNYAGYEISTPHPSNLVGGFNHWIDIRFGFRYITEGASSFLVPYEAYSYADSVGVVRFGQSVLDNLRLPVPVTGVGIDKYITSTDTLPYGRVIEYSDSEFQNALNRIAASIAAGGVGVLDVPWTIPRTQVEEGKREVEEEEEEAKPYVPPWADIWDQLGIKDLISTLTETKVDVDAPYKPSLTQIPTILPVWGYVSDFMAKALIWMQLWFSGFVLLPLGIKTALWAILIITIVTGLLGVFLN